MEVAKMTSPHTYRSFTLAMTIVWILLAAGFTAGALLLSLAGQLNRTGCAVLLTMGAAGAVFGYRALAGGLFRAPGVRLRRFRRPFPLLYLLCAAAAVVGGSIHAPTNYDALGYRVPRLLHWLSEGSWHWISTMDARMNFSAAGFEAMMLPTFGALHTLRLAFLINAVCYLVFPGLVYLAFGGLGVRRSVAALWMWIIPCGSCFVMQAGSIGNDLPGCVLVLAAMVFALRAYRTGRAADMMLAMLSAALMTGMKASNLPLLLPPAICLVAAFRAHPRLLGAAALAGVLSLPVSLLPIAVGNIRHTGHWSGAPGSPLALDDPLAGLVGNSILIGSAALVPAVFPPAETLNASFNARIDEPPMRWIKEGFTRIEMTHPQMASEENSGLGMGVTVALLFGLAGSWRQLSARRVIGPGGAVAAGFWIALLFYMTQLGNNGAQRLVAPYYAGLLLMPLLCFGSARVFRRRWWIAISFLAILPIVPALACNPARPLLPMQQIVESLMEKGIAPNLMTRMEKVYHTYANRADACRPVRDLLPPGTRVIGYAGTSGELQYSFWLPLGERKVVDFLPTPNRRPPDPSGLDAIVTSHWGCNDRFGMTPGELAEHLGWEITGTTSVQIYASTEPARWSVLVPADGTERK